MVMTLRKRAAPPPITTPSSSSSSSSSDDDTRSKNKKSRVLKSKPKPKFSGKENAYPSSDSYSGSDSESESEDENVYEKIREQRIRENKERMEKLGIFSLSSQFNGVKRPFKNPPVLKKRNPPLFPRSRPSDYRRSERIKKEPRGNYYETEGSLKGMGISIPEEWKTEVYTEEDEKLLGKCEAEWTLNVDGYGEDGERLYDPVNGTSCHQCRQKTIRKHTYCGKCRSPQGQICGDCLYTRYGENVLEATQDLVWMCPACRGICNCSRCRRTKGWPPVTVLYPKVIASGFKSMAHYLILTRRAGAMTKEMEEGTDVVDLTKEATQAPLRYEGSDTSAEWSESDGDDSDEEDSKAVTKNVAQSVDEHANPAETTVAATEAAETTAAAAEAAETTAAAAEAAEATAAASQATAAAAQVTVAIVQALCGVVGALSGSFSFMR